MIRLLALMSLLGTIAATAFAGQVLWRVVQQPIPDARLDDPAPDLATPVLPTAGVPIPRDWPALFGVVYVPEPQPPEPPEPQPPEPEPQPPSPPMPPLDSLGYSLRGVVSDGQSQWAIVSHPTGERLLRVGEALDENYVVTAIDNHGLWLATSSGGAAQLLAFAK